MPLAVAGLVMTGVLLISLARGKRYAQRVRRR